MHGFFTGEAGMFALRFSIALPNAHAGRLKNLRKMVLLERIELSTSPLPRGCSTTELQQRAVRRPGGARVWPPVRSGAEHATGAAPWQAMRLWIAMQARHVSNAEKSAKGRRFGRTDHGAIRHSAAPISVQLHGDRASTTRMGAGMADKDRIKPAAAEVSEAGKARRAREDARLAAALRANLARRKQQTRVRAADEGEDGST